MHGCWVGVVYLGIYPPPPNIHTNQVARFCRWSFEQRDFGVGCLDMGVVVQGTGYPARTPFSDPSICEIGSELQISKEATLSLLNLDHKDRVNHGTRSGLCETTTF